MREDFDDAARALARRTLEYVGWFDGTFNKRMECDVALKDHAFAVYVTLGEEPPARQYPDRRRKP